VVVGKLQEGKPTGNAYAHLFETSQILKGKKVALQVLLSHKSSVDPDDPLANQSPSTKIPQLTVGEYVLILRAEEVVGSFRPINPLSFLFESEPTFNYFVIRDKGNHAAWPIGSPEEQYITSLFANTAQAQIN
jgi:hypothetical protein